MSQHVLVAYASRYGSTREVAEAVAEELRGQGLEVDTEPAAEVREVAGYDAVVLGAGLYAGRLHPDARSLLRRRRGDLAEHPLAVFGLGPSDLEEEHVAQSRKQLDHGLERLRTPPAAVAVFGGRVDPTQMHWPLNRMPASDARDWDAIRAWAASLPAALGLEAGARAD